MFLTISRMMSRAVAGVKAGGVMMHYSNLCPFIGRF
jgi:hypothetical protein